MYVFQLWAVLPRVHQRLNYSAFFRVLTYLTSACLPEKMRLQRAHQREQMVLGHHLVEPRAQHPSPTTPKSRRSHKPQRIYPNHYNCFCLARPYLSSSHTVLFWARLSCCLPHTILFDCKNKQKQHRRACRLPQQLNYQRLVSILVKILTCCHWSGAHLGSTWVLSPR